MLAKFAATLTLVMAIMTQSSIANAKRFHEIAMVDQKTHVDPVKSAQASHALDADAGELVLGLFATCGFFFAVVLARTFRADRAVADLAFLSQQEKRWQAAKKAAKTRSATVRTEAARKRSQAARAGWASRRNRSANNYSFLLAHHENDNAA